MRLFSKLCKRSVQYYKLALILNKCVEIWHNYEFYIAKKNGKKVRVEANANMRFENGTKKKLRRALEVQLELRIQRLRHSQSS
jgi:hypothetical protein